MRMARAPYGGGYDRSYQCVFGGLNRNIAARDGELSGMENLSSDCYPILSPRPARYLVRRLSKPHGLAARDKLCWVDGTDFYYDGVKKGEVADSDKRFYFMNHWIVIWPDKLCYNTATDEFGSLEAEASVDGQVRCAIFCSSAAPGGVSSDHNCLRLDSTTVQGIFRPGDAVTISGCVAHPENNTTLIVREVVGTALYFYDNSLALDDFYRHTVGAEGLPAGVYNYDLDGHYYFFDLTYALDPGSALDIRGDVVTVIAGGATETIIAEMGNFGTEWLTLTPMSSAYAEATEVTVRRNVPDFDHLCECDNRLWGVRDTTVWCSYLGDPRVWYNFDGLATSAWSVEVGSGGAFTGACAYGGYPLLFKEDHIYRVYGTKPSNFQLMDTETLGCEAGSERSFAVAGQTLYYKSRAGFAAYAGGIPALIGDALGLARLEAATAGTDGRKYYVCVTEGDARALYVYDTVLGLWHREDGADVMDFAWCGGELYMLLRDGGLWQTGRVRTPQGQAEEEIVSEAEFAEFVDGTAERKILSRLHLRVSVEGELRLYVSYDDGPWLPAGCVAGEGPALRSIELIPRRCDRMRVKLRGVGDWKLWAMSREYRAGSARG